MPISSSPTSSPPELLSAVPAIPRDADGPVFAAPWEAQAFALAVSLHGSGVFTWNEWAKTLGEEIAAAPQARYYHCWLAALERILAQKRVVPEAERYGRHLAWIEAAHATPHGEPIVLERQARDGP